MSLGVRGACPIWLLADLQGNLMDDTFYMYVLQNTLPYLPATVYHDPDLTIPWTSPIQVLGNGTLPNDIFFECGADFVYRLEFRQNDGVLAPSQNDALIYEVNDYTVSCSGGSTPVTNSSFATDNQITNPQFSLISFESPLVISSTDPAPIEVAPGWFLELAGTGTATITQVPLDSSNLNPSNAPYALQLTLNGWTSESVFLRQRFQQNGMLWANKTVASAVTARIEGAPQSISAELIDSNSTVLASVLDATAINSAWTEYTGYGTLDATTNPDVPPAAYIDYKLAIPSNIDVYLTSFQLIAQDAANISTPGFEQDSIDRQIDHTFHYYKDSILLQPKESVLTGWDFGLNPWQSRSTTLSNFSTFGYAADQTFVVQRRYVEVGSTDNIQVGQASVALNYGFQVTAVTSTNDFALGQYIDPTTIRPYWGSTMSTLVKLVAQKQSSSNNLRVKMRLIYRSSLPSALAQAEPIATWATGGDPVFATGWTAIVPKNDPVYFLENGANTLTFEGMTLPASVGSNMTLGIIVYTIDPMIESGTPDNIVFNKISLVPNEFAIDCNVLTFDETLRRCEFYYEKSYPLNILPGAATLVNIVTCSQKLASGVGGKPGMFYIQYHTKKRTASPTLNLYNYNGSAAGVVLAVLYSAGAPIVETPAAIANWLKAVGGGDNGQAFTAATNTTIVAGAGDETFIGFQYSCNARLGV